MACRLIAGAFHILCFIHFVPASFNQSIAPNCWNTIYSVFAKTYYRWPLHISCKYFRYNETFLLRNISDFNSSNIMVNIQCSILKGSHIVFNRTADINEIQAEGYNTTIYNNSSLNYTLIFMNLSNNRCISLDYQITPIDETCSSFLAKKDKIKMLPQIWGKDFKASCKFESKRTPFDLNSYGTDMANLEGVTYRWFHNCNSISFNKSELRIEQLDYEDGGTYVCAATYNGVTAYVAYARICVEQVPPGSNLISLNCRSTNLIAQRGKSVEQLCTINYGIGHLDDVAVSVILTKLKTDTYDAENETMWCLKKNGTTKGGNRLCEWEVQNENICVFNETPTEEQRKKKALIKIKIMIRNVTNKDYGIYMLATSKSDNIMFRIDPNSVPELLTESTVIGVCICSVLIILAFLIMLLYKRTLVRVYYKRYFETGIVDDKTFGVYLAYSFDGPSMDKFSRNYLTDIIPKLRDVLENLGYSVYDEMKDGFILTNRAENIRKAVEISHRVIIVLSPDFIKDEWSMFALQKGFRETIYSRSKLIFVLFPGIKEYLNQHSKYNSSVLAVQRAIKLNYSVQLKKSPIDKRLKLYLEDAMPKLKPTKRQRAKSDLSITSSVSMLSGEKMNFQRCFRNETNETTIIDESIQRSKEHDENFITEL